MVTSDHLLRQDIYARAPRPNIGASKPLQKPFYMDVEKAFKPGFGNYRVTKIPKARITDFL